MEITQLDERVKKFIRQQGWYEGRKVNIDNWIEQLVKEGYLCFSYAKEVLEELGGIYIKSGNVRIGNCIPGEFDFNALDAASGEFDRMEIFESLAGESLFPLGMIHQYFMYVGPSEKIYMGDCTKLYIVGNNLEDFLNNVILGLRKPILIENCSTNG